MKYLLLKDAKVCGECEIITEFYCEHEYRFWCPYLMEEVKSLCKHKDCPLKDLPERKEPIARVGSADCIYKIYELYDDDADAGWNDCLDAITGKTNG